MNNKEICICAAVKTTDGLIIRGHRHGDCFYSILRRKKQIDKSTDAQGFITSENRFVNRQEAYLLQINAGITSIDMEGYKGKLLFSEDLY